MPRLLIVFLLLLALPAAAQDDAPPLDPETLTATVLMRLPLLSAPASTSAHLAPSGEHLMHVKGPTFCMYALIGVEGGCADLVERLGDMGRRVRIDSETIAWSPDGEYVAFTSDAWRFLRDPDIWVLDVDSGLFANLTNDGYDGGILFGDDIPDTAYVDVSPTWMPDGRIAFARHSASASDVQPELWAVAPDSGRTEKLADLLPSNDFRNLIISMDWSPDGSTMAYIVDSPDNPFAGVWLYDAADGSTRPLYYKTEAQRNLLHVAFSPDGASVLLLDSIREFARSFPTLEDPTQTGYTVIDVADGAVHPVTSSDPILSAGWLPDGGLIYTANNTDTVDGGLYVKATPDAPGRKILDRPMRDEGDRGLPVFGPTSLQVKPLIVHPNGRLLLATAADLTLVVQLE